MVRISMSALPFICLLLSRWDGTSQLSMDPVGKGRDAGALNRGPAKGANPAREAVKRLTSGGRFVPDSATLSHPGRLAQLGEHQLDKLGVTGSSPVPPTIGKPR